MMIDYGPFKWIHKCVHIDQIYPFEQLLLENHRNDRIGKLGSVKTDIRI